MATTKHMNEHCLQGHQLELINGPIKNKKREYFDCDGCKERGFGHRYRCDKCDFDVHEECYRPSLTVQHRGYKGHTFEFHPRIAPTRFCDACGKQVRGYVYHCKDLGMDFHPCCNNLPPSVKFTDGWELFLQEDQIGSDHVQRVGSKKTKACFRCKNTTLSGTIKGAPGWSYVSECGFNRCHVYCMRERLWEILRSLENARLAAEPVSKRNKGNAGARGRTMSKESWWEPLSFASTMTGFILGDPTDLLTSEFFEIFNG